ncbi:hypothetical protein HYH03_013072 [Edaphochlamys debaryana]|uniref:C2H2-type domain-containing protein n=1 Tax=Edaphochlamys debaryana TaxID=47281 RepID=A0A835XRK8_9CHLO|nr:hypothetical protein HYH03_013072 [Edaphochlamys debaryana]|eukprot:KAG2488385.1 hypothetical protein HYH03_013072 [Edaphochlamys debaryana]
MRRAALGSLHPCLRRPIPPKSAYSLRLGALAVLLALATASNDTVSGDPLNDLVLVQASSSNRLPLLLATRVWRRQVPVRCFFALNDSSLVAALNADPIAQQLNEHYAYYPDDKELLHTLNPGALRQAIIVVLAQRHFGDSYKWMLYGDDDTQFFLTGVKRLVAQFDPDQPLALTDHHWYKSSRSHPEAPRCLPCNFNTSLLKSTTPNAFVPRPACPFCTRDFSCGHYDDTRHCSERHDGALREVYGPRLLEGHRHSRSKAREASEDSHVALDPAVRRQYMQRLNANYADWYRKSREEAEGKAAHQLGTIEAAVYGKAWMAAALPFPFCVRHDPRVHVNDTERQSESCSFAKFHGGAGLVLSIGLMLALDLDAAEKHIVETMASSGGDALLSEAIAQQGFGFTDPGARFHFPGAQPYHYHLFDGRGPHELNSEMDFLECRVQGQIKLFNPRMWFRIHPEERMWMLEHTVAIHASARGRTIEEVAAEVAQRAEAHMALLALAASLQTDPRVASRTMALWEAQKPGSSKPTQRALSGKGRRLGR